MSLEEGPQKRAIKGGVSVTVTRMWSRFCKTGDVCVMQDWKPMCSCGYSSPYALKTCLKCLMCAIGCVTEKAPSCPVEAAPRCWGGRQSSGRRVLLSPSSRRRRPVREAHPHPLHQPVQQLGSTTWPVYTAIGLCCWVLPQCLAHKTVLGAVCCPEHLRKVGARGSGQFPMLRTLYSSPHRRAQGCPLALPVATPVPRSFQPSFKAPRGPAWYHVTFHPMGKASATRVVALKHVCRFFDVPPTKFQNFSSWNKYRFAAYCKSNTEAHSPSPSFPWWWLLTQLWCAIHIGKSTWVTPHHTQVPATPPARCPTTPCPQRPPPCGPLCCPCPLPRRPHLLQS